ncbi:outer membrane protein [Aureimonas sp. AU20]|uniref:outer membrane protein n=1 Tax=Aureimonas sp. AU20 TaxID=1349819 RepID=UPI00071F2C20|nr:outer membrane protein [Aureimonas sp. AU20]ALN74027.1 hypothetical protein M673_14975 [Aureimonas sp. AU20]
MTFKTLLFLGAAALSLPTMASAADMGPIYREAPELVPVEIGTGWYLRGDATYDFSSDLEGSRTLRTPFGATTEPYRDASLDETFGGGGGIGYRFTDMLRADVTARYSQPDFNARTDSSIFCGVGCTVRDRGDAAMWDVMANAYVDLGTLAGFTPYVGGGVGAVHLSYDKPSLEFCSALYCSTAPTKGEDSWRFAWSLSAGVAYDLTKNLALDIGYRYLNVESGDNYKLAGATVGLPGQTGIGSDDGFDRHTISAGLRYSLW